MLTCSFSAQAKLVDLSEWRQDGSLSSGNWTVASDKHSVYQSINGNPTAFMSKKTYEFRTFRGDITVNGNDDDYIGFIVSKTASSFLIFSWKGGNQNLPARLGYSLIHVNGSLDTLQSYGFTLHENDTAHTQILARDRSIGWNLGQTYSFEVQVYSGRVVAKVDNKTIFDVDTPYATTGKFGFFNWSQAGVKYDAIEELFQPIVEPITATVSQGTVARLTGTWKDENEYETHSCAIGTDPKLGVVNIEPPCTVEYIPYADQNGVDSFSYVVTDSEGLSSDAPITITTIPLGGNVDMPSHIEADKQTIVEFKKTGTFTDSNPFPAVQLVNAPEWLSYDEENQRFIANPSTSDVGLVTDFSIRTSNSANQSSRLGPFDLQVIPKENILKTTQSFTVLPSKEPLKTSKDEYVTTLYIPPLRSGENNLVHGEHNLELTVDDESPGSIEVNNIVVSAGETKTIPVLISEAGTNIQMKTASDQIGALTHYKLVFPWLDSPDDLRYIKQQACGLNDSIRCEREIDFDRHTISNADVLVMIRKSDSDQYYKYAFDDIDDVTNSNIQEIIGSLSDNDIVAVNVSAYNEKIKTVLNSIGNDQIGALASSIPESGSAVLNVVIGSSAQNKVVDNQARWGSYQVSWVDLASDNQ